MTARLAWPESSQHHVQACFRVAASIRKNVSPSSAYAAGRRSAAHRSRSHAWTPIRKLICRAAASEQADGNPLVKAGVSGLTALLKALGIGRRAKNGQEPVRRLDRVRPGDIDALMDCIRSDFEDHAYFVTGDIYEGVYADDCFFGDPTVSFAGLQKWRKNLQLLVPFLIEPKIDLLCLEELRDPAMGSDSAKRLKADWKLSTYLKLPWKPFIDINGSTEYTLDPTNQQVIRHIESWSVSGTEAILQILKPSNGPAKDI